jgi:UDP:flavonoid glycosyltransferase YjiC (YdhE family)
MKGKRVLIAPLDWGLGHATRCIPIIQSLLQAECEVIIAGDGSSLELLKEEFPAFTFFSLPGYNPKYPSGNLMAMKMFLQLPHFLSVIKREHEIVERIVADNKIDLVISDNRYGCWSRKAKNIFITHQLNILLPAQISFLSPLLKFFVHKAIKKFDLCWIPDNGGDKSLTGVMSSPARFQHRFIGMLSRFTKCLPDQSFKYEVLVILSGPEPQRSLLEKILFDQICEVGFKTLMVRGVIGSSQIKNIHKHFQMVDFLNTAQLQAAICQSEIIIARSGYSTIMDLNKLEKKAIFIPTPGQTEQKYLAAVLSEKGIAYSTSQQKFNLVDALPLSKTFAGFGGPTENDLLKRAIEEVLQ